MERTRITNILLARAQITLLQNVINDIVKKMYFYSKIVFLSNMINKLSFDKILS